MMLPSYNLLYFKNILDVAFLQFFEDCNDKFVKIDGQYVLAEAFNVAQIEEHFFNVVVKVLNELIKPYDLVKAPEVYFIIGACQPRDNFLLKYKGEDFPLKLQKTIYDEYSLKYLLNEKDIKVDLVKFNEACVNVFNKIFSSNSSLKDRKNVIFMTHKRLDCYSMFKVLKCILGKSRCRNLFKEKFNEVKSPIVAVNDLIDLNIHQKMKANRDQEFKAIVDEIKQFLNLKLLELNSSK